MRNATPNFQVPRIETDSIWHNWKGTWKSGLLTAVGMTKLRVTLGRTTRLWSRLEKRARFSFDKVTRGEKQQPSDQAICAEARDLLLLCVNNLILPFFRLPYAH